MNGHDMIPLRADELKPGDLVDLENDPHDRLRNDPASEFEHGEVYYINRDPDGLWIAFEGIGGEYRYDHDHVFQALNRDIAPERFEE